MDGYTFERALVSVLAERIEQAGLKHKPVAIAAWSGEREDAASKWRKIRNGTPPRRLNVADAYDMARALGVSFLEFCGLAQAKLLQQQQGVVSVAIPPPSPPEGTEKMLPQEKIAHPRKASSA